ncbi:hypothetical protein Btru_065904 [Bulinus truncatus]|nr:hypothetical protein Btru_065904 [Bulinus truncatus]
MKLWKNKDNQLLDYEKRIQELQHDEEMAVQEITIAGLNDDLIRYKNLQDENASEIRRQNELLKQQENILSETRQQLVISQSQLEAANEDIEKLILLLGLPEKKEEISRCEDMIHQLTEELKPLRKNCVTYGRVKELEETNKELKDRVQDSQHLALQHEEKAHDFENRLLTYFRQRIAILTEFADKLDH